MATETNEVKYVLFSHISYNEAEDYAIFEEWNRRSGTPTVPSLPNYRIVAELTPFLNELTNLLTDNDNPGILILFYAKGYAKCLEDIADAKRSTKQDNVKEKDPDLHCAGLVQKCLQEMFRSLGPRVRVVTALDLHDIFSRIESGYAQNLIQWFIGLQEETIRYDAPKVVEALIRVRMIGSGAPIFRIDQDVLFRKSFPNDPDRGNASLPALSLRDPIKECVRAFHERRDDPRMAAFLFSGSYDPKPLADPGNCRNFGAWSRAFATRCFPALCIKHEPLKAARESEDRAKEADKKAKKARKESSNDAEMKEAEAREAAQKASEDWDAYVNEALDPELMCRFFGIKKTRNSQDSSLEADLSYTKVGIGWLGAHPLVSIISGALLCINDSAILDLPPFSNFNMNVSWIDDHLKYSLHRELRHFTTDSIAAKPPKLCDAKIDSVQVVKGRQPIRNLAEYVLGDYLPTLLYGSVMDAWITTDPIIKFRPETLDDALQTKWNTIPKTGPSSGVLPMYLQEVLQRGRYLSPLELRQFRRELLRTALARITYVRNVWSTLENGGEPTFASAWAFGESRVNAFVDGMTGKAKGLVRDPTRAGEDLKLGHLNEEVREGLMMLVDDTVTYLDMTLSWPKTVQLIRSIEAGTLKTDLFRSNGAI